MLGDKEGSFHVDAKHPLKVRQLRFFHTANQSNSRVVYQNIEISQACKCLLHRILVGDIAHHHGRAGKFPG